MRSTLAIAWRDIRSVFVSPIAYVVLTGFVLLAGWFFFILIGNFNQMVAQYSSARGFDTSFLNLNDGVITPLLQNLSVVLVIVVPMITMRSFAEERTMGTYELLFTSPVSVTSMVFGKFLAGAFLVTVMIGLTLVFPAILLSFGNPEVGLIASGYLGLYLMAICFVSIGVFSSALTSNQIIATVSALVISLGLFVINWPADQASGAMKAILLDLAITEHLSTMIRGIIDTKDIAYFVSVPCVFLFLAYRAVESARWK